VNAPDENPLPPIDERPRGLRRRPVVAGLLVVVLAALAGAAIAHFAWPASSSSSLAFGGSGGGFRELFPSDNGDGNAAPSGSAAASSKTTASVAARVDPGLVDINTTTVNGGIGAGTGMVVTPSGEVITNNHVIAGATRISVTDIGNGKTYTARVVGYDRADDVAVLALQGASGLKTVPLGDSSTVRVGAAVVTIGNAGGVGGTPIAAAGSVAALGQSITAADDSAGSAERLTGLIEVSGQLEPGDSGGPLVDNAGNVVGMDTAAASNFSFRSSAGNGFAIPINQVLAIARQIVAGKASSSIHIGPSALLGVLIGPIGGTGGFGGGSGARGVIVEETLSGTPAAGAGLTQGDTITSLDGQAVTSPGGLTALMAKHRPGDRVRLGWLDTAGNAHTATLRLAAGPAA
jgi:S1-C subfamily serine protease